MCHIFHECVLLSSFGSYCSFYSAAYSSGSTNYIIMHVILSVPVPSDIVISPFAIPWSIISSIMKEVSPLAFIFLLGAPNSDLPFYIFNGDLTLLPSRLLLVFYF